MNEEYIDIVSKILTGKDFFRTKYNPLHYMSYRQQYPAHWEYREKLAKFVDALSKELYIYTGLDIHYITRDNYDNSLLYIFECYFRDTSVSTARYRVAFEPNEIAVKTIDQLVEDTLEWLNEHLAVASDKMQFDGNSEGTQIAEEMLRAEKRIKLYLASKVQNI